MAEAVPSSSVPSNDDYLDPPARAALAGLLLSNVMTLKGGIARLTARVNDAHTSTAVAPAAPSASRENNPEGLSTGVGTAAAPAEPSAMITNNPEGPALPLNAVEELSADEVSSLLSGLGSPTNVPGQ